MYAILHFCLGNSNECVVVDSRLYSSIRKSGFLYDIIYCDFVKILKIPNSLRSCAVTEYRRLRLTVDGMGNCHFPTSEGSDDNE